MLTGSDANWFHPLANRSVSKHIVWAGRFLDKQGLEAGQFIYPVDCLFDVPDLVGINHDINIITNFFPYQAQPVNVLFKIAADRAKDTAAGGFLESLFTDGYFYLAVTLYGTMTLVWIWILMRVPLSRAYPFVVLGFIFTPAFAVVFFDESVNVWYFVGFGYKTL